MYAHNRKWKGRDLWNLLYLSKEQLLETYPEQNWQNLRKKRKLYRKRIREGMELPPENPEGASGQNIEQMRKLSELLERSGIKAEQIDQIKNVRIGTYQMLTKNNEGEAEVHDLEVANVQFIPKSSLREEDFIRQAKPTVIRPNKVTKKNSTEKIAIVLPDIQAGFRRYEDGTLDPFHDESALDIALQIIKDVQPDQVILNGDNLDLPQFGRYKQENSFALTINPTLDYVHQFLAKIRANAPNSKVAYLAGNHEMRLNNYLGMYAREVHGIRQANTVNKVLTVPFLLNLASIDVEYLSGYPANRYWINDRLAVIHGKIARAAGQTAAAVVRSQNYSQLFGHVHRYEYAARTIDSGKVGSYVVAQSFGCLARIDGAVPSYHSATDDDGRVVRQYENWQQGLGIVHYHEGDSPFDTQQISIRTFNNYETRYNGKVYTPNGN